MLLKSTARFALSKPQKSTFFHTNYIETMWLYIKEEAFTMKSLPRGEL